MQRILQLAAAFALLLVSIMTTTAQSTASLTARQQALVTISAYTATGNQPRLHEVLSWLCVASQRCPRA